jgi:hypothetical protein
MKFVLGFNLLLFLFRVFYVLYSPLDLTPEEAQYWDWSRHLDLSYYSKPPMVAYVNFLTTSLLGNTELAVRITPIVLSFLMSIFTYLFAKKLFDERVAIISSTLTSAFRGLGYQLPSHDYRRPADILLGFEPDGLLVCVGKKRCLLVAVAGYFFWLCFFE